MFTKEELGLIDSALTAYWLQINEQHQKDLAKNRHNAEFRPRLMQKVSDLQRKVFYLEISM